MEQLLCHLVGDYLLQSKWMAENKLKISYEGAAALVIHCFLYSLPFLLITPSINVVLIFGTHFLY